MEDEAASCSRPPVGWSCSRQEGHSGPCAAREATKDPQGHKDTLTSRPGVWDRFWRWVWQEPFWAIVGLAYLLCALLS